MSKLMIPLFLNGQFNRKKRGIRAEFVAKVSNGVDSYCLWHKAGKPDVQYPRAENDSYFLYVELNGYLAPLRMTELQLIDQCGFPVACRELYGGSEKRDAFLHELRQKASADHDESLIRDAVVKEQEMTQKLGRKPELWANYIRQYLDDHCSIYKKSVKSDGSTFPDFIGALCLGDIDTCVELRLKFNEKKQAEAEKKKAEDKAFCEDQNRIAEEKVQKAIDILKCGGTLDNDLITFYQACDDICKECIVICLAHRYHVDIPARTMGWIKNKLVSITVEDGKCNFIRYIAGNRCSQRVFSVIDVLIHAVQNEN